MRPQLLLDLPRTSIGQIHPGMPVFDISEKTEAGFDEWVEWLLGQARMKLNR